MEIISAIEPLRERLQAETDIAFVPTMGNLHDGHLALVETARARARCVVASIFVNPLQFGPQEDLDKYPRTLREDCAKLLKAGVDVVFTPSEQDLFPEPQSVAVLPPPVANELCGASRPGHFQGVATIVLKLFNIVRPRLAVFGKKDYQQLHVIRTMVRQLNVPVVIVGVETCRASDGLALSSRNGYLNPHERQEAVRLQQILEGVRQSLLHGRRDFRVVEEEAVAKLAAHGWRPDYVAIRNQDTLAPAGPEDGRLVVMGAAWLGTTRLIDNLEVCLTGVQVL